MTLSEAMFDLHQKGLPYPSAVSVFFLYHKTGSGYRQDDNFDTKFRELLEIQKTVRKIHMPLV